MGFNIVTLEPTFTSSGMEIAQINASQEVGTIQSVEPFTPPFTVSATVEGTVSNGHTFGFAITSANASSGVLVYGNLNPTNCSNLGNCGDPTTCGNPANSAIPPNQCYYGIDAKVGSGTSWPHQAKMFLTPSVNVTYTLEISVDASGSAQYIVGQGGQVLGQSTAQVGMGPFYVIMEQGEGSPVAQPGPNQAYWKSVSLSPVATTLTTSTLPGPPGPSPGLTPIDWIIIVIALAVVLFIIFLLYARRRGFTVKVQDSRTLAPIPKANVTTDGPKNLAGVTDKDGQVKFGEVKEGDYSVQSTAAGYYPSTPAIVNVKKRTEYVVRLNWIGRATAEGAGSHPPSEGPRPVEAAGLEGRQGVTPPAVPSPSLPRQQPQETVAQPTQAAVTPTETMPAPMAPPPGQQGPEDFEGFGGDRIRQIIKTFQMKGAISPETALTAEELGLSRLFVRIMKRRKGRTTIFMEINGRYYLNQDALKEK